MKIFFTFTALLFLLSGCDKGKKSYDAIAASTEKYLVADVGIKNLADYLVAAELFRSHYLKYQDSQSGKQSLEKLKTIKQKVAIFSNAIDRQEQEAVLLWNAELASLDEKSKKLKTDALAWKKKLKRFSPYSGQVGSCYVHIKGREFSEKNQNIFDVEIYRVKKIGDQEFQAEILYDLSDYDIKYPAKKQEKRKAGEFDSKYKNLSAEDKKISCENTSVFVDSQDKILSLATILANVEVIKKHLERKKSVFNDI